MDKNFIPLNLQNKYTTYKDAENYMEHHKIKELFGFLMMQLIVHRPKNLIPFLLELLDQCMLFRSGYRKPPLLFTKNHIHQIFKSFDLHNKGVISVKDYITSMNIFGITDFNKSSLNPEGLVTQDAFETEVMNKLTTELSSMIEYPKND